MTSEGLDRPIVARLLSIDRRTRPYEIGRDEILQLQRAVADQNLLRRGPVFAGQLLAQRSVAGLLAILQYDIGILPDRRVETSPQFIGRERLWRRYTARKDYLVASSRHLPTPCSLAPEKPNPILYPALDANGRKEGSGGVP